MPQHLSANQHYLEAERILDTVGTQTYEFTDPAMAQLAIQKWQYSIAVAQVHATLATAANVGVASYSHEEMKEFGVYEDNLGEDPADWRGRDEA